MSLARPLVLLGMMGSGKTTLASALAEDLGVLPHSLDAAVVATAGKEISAIFASDGEEAFRDLESQVLAKALAAGEPQVIDCGGGVVDRKANRELLAASDSLRCYLDLPLAELIARTGADPSRPMLQGDDYRKQIELLHQRRDGLYREVATHVATIAQGEGVAQTKARIMAMLA